MKIFLDTADLQAIKHWLSTGIIDGVTTNPTLLQKVGGNPAQQVKEIARLLANRDVSVEVTEEDPSAVYAQAKSIAAIAPNVVVKIPCHTNYYATIQRLVGEQIPINVTLVFSVAQALAMCKLGVKYISPFIGRLDDVNESGIMLIQSIRQMIDMHSFNTQLLAASIRSVERLQEALLAGADIATVPVNILEQALQHPLTDKGMQKFQDDWKKLGVSTFP